MTYARREEILAKETLTVADLAELCEIGTTSARELMQRIRAKSDKLQLAGRIHVSDYFRFFGIPYDGRYSTIAKEKLLNDLQSLYDQSREGRKPRAF